MLTEYHQKTRSPNMIKKTFWAIYWSFRQFGQEALGTEEPWFTLAIVRLTELEKLDGGLSHLLGALLDAYMVQP